MTDLVLLTGSSGGVGRMIAPHLVTHVRVRGFDLVDGGDVDGGAAIETHVGSILDPDALDAALEGVDAVVHLAGIPKEAPWSDVLRANIDGTQRVLEAARRRGVTRVVLASSNHAVGFVPLDGSRLPGDLPPEPDTFYGVSKAALEALGHYYHRKHGMDVVSIRIGGATRLPETRRALQNWISPRDLADLVLAALSAPSPVDAVVWGMSANSGSPYDLDSARALGYAPEDDATRHEPSDPAPATDADRRFVGGPFTVLPQPED